jgi:Bardet-Biedl syndrome 9 protein
MSCFKLKEWWTVQAGSGEEFGHSCLCVGNLDNVHEGSDKIVLGSLEGILRVYAPTRPQFRIEDLLVEEDLGQPILQVLTGLFLPLSMNIGIAVLHPRTLVVYELQLVGAEKGGYHVLEKSYEHELGIDGRHFSAFNMSSGSFGGVQGREMIVVQSMDGKLQIFEQTANAFTRQFVDCLYPGPIRYLPRLDAFVTVSTTREAQCFRYQVLANSQGDIGGSSSAPTKTGAFGLTAMRSALMEWSVILGETCLQIVDGSFSGTEQPNKKGSGGAELLLVCEHSIFLVKESGGVLQQRRVDRPPSCTCSYQSGQRDLDNFIIASRDGTIQVYNRFNLVWAAKSDTVPVSVAVASFAGKAGLLVTLSDTGRLDISFLGTKPPLSIASSTSSRDLDYDKIDEEHRSLLQIIREHQSASKLEPKDKLVLRSQVPRQLDFSPAGSDVELPAGLVLLPENVHGPQGLMKICVRLYVAHSGNGSANDISITISAPSFVHVVPKNYIIKSVSARSTPVMIKLYMYVRREEIASSLKCDVVATYKSKAGEPRIANHTVQLPLFLACTLRIPVKAAAFKFTLDTGVAPIPLTEIFDDLIFALKEQGQNVSEVVGNTEAQAMGFQVWANGTGNPNSPPATVSILLSKTGGRYRVQSDCLPALHLFTSELEKRLNLVMAVNTDEKITAAQVANTVSKVKCDDKMPLDAYFDEITAHFDVRKQLQGLYSELNDTSHLFRVIQKRLLTRFKDRNASLLGGLDVVMRETYQNLLRLADMTSTAQKELQKRQQNLGCISKLLVQLTGMRLSMTASDRSLLETYLCPDLPYSTSSGGDGVEGTGWEEAVELSLTYLLKTALAKNPKSTTKVNTSPVEMPESVDTLKQRISLVFVKLEERKSMTVPEERVTEGEGSSKK